MIYFETEAITGDLILIKANNPTPPACPVLARRATRLQPVLLTFALWVCSFFAPLAIGLKKATKRCCPPTIPFATKQKWAVLMFLGGVVAGLVAESYIDRMILG